MMRPFGRISSKPADIALTGVPQSVINLSFSELECLLGLDAQVAGLHGVHGEVAGVPQAAPLRGADPDQALVSDWQLQQIVNK